MQAPEPDPAPAELTDHRDEVLPPRGAGRADGTMFVAFQPAVSPEALKEMSQRVRRWRIHTRTRHDLSELAALINPVVAGWMNYYGRFYRPQMSPSCNASTPT
ncbi:group II intron maturase-specific domain-containing protein [Frankia sp. AvcI1]|uniref:group II intron maturase-specific domain-containing protein n=2 Tax=Frankia sp. AvcI1 TaxID=573496 RepID=UPI002117B7CD|nr:group II intron maturase-specific domain-containing protein [Frankia sp. AvcI1]